METEKELFKNVFAKLGFEIQHTTSHNFIAFVMGKDYGVYIDISYLCKSFSIEVINDIFEQKIFYWQHFENYEEIYNLIVKNHILSEQILEKLGGTLTILVDWLISCKIVKKSVNLQHEYKWFIFDFIRFA